MYDHGVVENAVSAVMSVRMMSMMSMMKWSVLLSLTNHDNDDDNDDRVRNMTGGAIVCDIPISVTSGSKHIDGVVVVTFSLEIVFVVAFGCFVPKILSLSLQ